MSVTSTTRIGNNIHSLADYQHPQKDLDQLIVDTHKKINAHLAQIDNHFTQTDKHLENVDKNLEKMESTRKLCAKAETQDEKSLFKRIGASVYNALMSLISMITNLGRQLFFCCKNRFSTKTAEYSESKPVKENKIK